MLTQARRSFAGFGTAILRRRLKHTKKFLSAHKAEYAGREEELAQFFGMPAEIFIGFIDGINTSLHSELPLEEIEKDTEIKLDIDFEKLYFNMHEAKADWLYNLREWDGVLSSERRREITKPVA